MPSPSYPITGIAICNSTGSNCQKVRQSLFEGRSGLGPSPIPLPFESVVGAVDFELPTLPPELEAWTTRTTQIASLLLSELGAKLDQLRSRWRPERIAVLLGTSTGGAAPFSHRAPFPLSMIFFVNTRLDPFCMSSVLFPGRSDRPGWCRPLALQARNPWPVLGGSSRQASSTPPLWVALTRSAV